MTNLQSKAVTDLVKDVILDLLDEAGPDKLKNVILDLLDEAPEDKLIDVYAALKGAVPQSMPVSRKTPAPPEPGETEWQSRLPAPGRVPKSGEYPAATTQCTLRAIERLGRWGKLGDIAEEVQREQPAISRESVSSAISRLVQAGVLKRRGETRASEYAPAGRAKALR